MIHGSLTERTGETSFLRELLRQLRSQEPTSWNGKDDLELLAPFLEARRGGGREDDEPDPDVFWRLEVFHSAVGLAIEARTGVVCTPLLKMQHAGFGRLVLLGGRLVVVSRFLRGLHGFRFQDLERLVEAGERLVAAGVAMIARYPEVAHHSA